MFYSNMFIDLLMVIFNRKSLLLFACCISMLFSQASITGNITDTDSKEPLIGVNVLLLETTRKLDLDNLGKTVTIQTNTSYGSSTDVEGDFIIKNVPIGEYTIKVMYIGYKEKMIPIDINENKNYILNIKMNMGEIALEETKVTAVYEREEKKTEAPATIETVSSKEIEQASTSNLGSYLQGLKGVDFTASGVNNYSLSIRGFNSSFSTRLLMLTDGRPANVPSLRVVNFSTIPITSDDVERIEVVLGPATALYGANAHSGVINIISKAPSLSEGFAGSFAGTADERNLKKFDARYAKKINNKISFKLSGSHFSATEWPFISEREYKAHRNPWVGFGGRQIDGKDNNTSIKAGFSGGGGISPSTDKALKWTRVDNNEGIPILEGNAEGGGNGWGGFSNYITPDSVSYIMIGDGEANHGDLDGDGVAGEDWYNGFDDDGDGLIDEDYFWADGVDNREPWDDNNCLGPIGYECIPGVFDFLDLDGNEIHTGPEPFIDENGDGEWNFTFDNNGDGICNTSTICNNPDDPLDCDDQCEWWQDIVGDGYETYYYDLGEPAYENWDDWDSDGSYDDYNDDIDERIDDDGDWWLDGVDNNGNGMIDENDERRTDDEYPSAWALAIDGDVLISYGRANKYLMDGSRNPWYVENATDEHLRGIARYNEKTFELEFDVLEWDFGDDNIAGDYYYDFHGDEIEHRGEPGILEPCTDPEGNGFGGSDCSEGEMVYSTSSWGDYGLDGFPYYSDLDTGNGHQAVFRYANSQGEIIDWLLYDDNGNPIWLYGPDEGEGDGIFQPGDTWNDNGDWIAEPNEAGWNMIEMFDRNNHIIGVDDDGNGIIDDCYTIDDAIIVDNIIQNCWIDPSTNEIVIIEENPSLGYIGSQNQSFIYNYLIVSSYNNGSYLSYDIWPPPDNIYNDFSDIISDCGQDGYCWDFEASNQDSPQTAYDIWGNPVFDDLNENGIKDAGEDWIRINGPDYGEGNGIISFDNNEFDGIYDTSDEIWGTMPEPFNDENNDGIWNEGESYEDLDGNGSYTQGDWHPNLVRVNDTNGDGVNDYPDFEVINDKIEFRLDYDISNDINMTFQTGYAYTKTQQVTGVGRYLADGWKSSYYQLRGKFNNWYAQAFFNSNDAGKTRGYNLGDMIIDQSSNFGVQVQNVFTLDKYRTEFTWGLDYMQTNPFTNGSVLNDGPNGFDDDEDSRTFIFNDIDEDNDGDIYWDADEAIFGVDEEDEFEKNIVSNELGFYFQAKTDLFNNEKWELITSARLDYHDQLKEEGLLFGPKIGLTYKPTDFTTWRLGYGRAFNTPTITALHTNLIFGETDFGDNYKLILKGNKDGTPYARVGSEAQFGEYGFDINLIDPFYYQTEVDENGNYSYILNDDNSYSTVSFGQSLSDCGDCQPYEERIQGAPLFYNLRDTQYPNDYIPLDTLNHMIFIPSAYNDGVNYTPLESVNLPDVDPLRSESMRTLELGYKTWLSLKSQFTGEIYFTKYDNFFSPATFITPLVKKINDDGTPGDVIGLIPTSLSGTYAPYATAWDGKDNDDDWSGLGTYIPQHLIPCDDPSDEYPCKFTNATQHQLDYEALENSQYLNPSTDWSDIFGWSQDDKNDDCLDPASDDYDPTCYQDPGEWGFVDILCRDESVGGICDTPNGEIIYTIVQPYQVWDPNSLDDNPNNNNDPASANLGTYEHVDRRWLDVGVDEYSTLMSGHYEAEMTEDGRKGFPNKLPIIVLSSLNYGKVYHSGIDVGFTHFFSEKFIVDLNFTLFNSTDYYNELTKTYDPINSPKFKFNLTTNINTNKLGTILMKLRYVDKFDWADGTWSGTIGPYTIVDLHYNYNITDYLKFGITATNLFDDKHRELIGGAVMGRQVILRLTTLF